MNHFQKLSAECTGSLYMVFITSYKFISTSQKQVFLKVGEVLYKIVGIPELKGCSVVLGIILWFLTHCFKFLGVYLFLFLFFHVKVDWIYNYFKCLCIFFISYRTKSAINFAMDFLLTKYFFTFLVCTQSCDICTTESWKNNYRPDHGEIWFCFKKQN